MPDVLDDRLSAAFQSFRAETVRRLRLAGVVQIRASAKRRRRRTLSLRSVLLLAAGLVASAVGASGVVAPAESSPPLRPLDLVGRTVALPPWPDLVPPRIEPCPLGYIDAFGLSSATASERSAVNVKSAATTDVNRDGRPDVVAVLECGGRAGPEGTTVEQVVAFSGSAGGPIDVIGQVMTTSRDTRSIVAVSPAEPGYVSVRVQDYPSDVLLQPREQLRRYRFANGAFEQSEGATEFGPNPNVANLSVSAAPLLMQATTGGGYLGSLRVTVGNAGPKGVGSVRILIFDTTVTLLVADQRCELAGQPGTNAVNTGGRAYVCQAGVVPAGEASTLTLAVTGSTPASDDVPSVHVALMAGGFDEVPDVDASNNDFDVLVRWR